MKTQDMNNANLDKNNNMKNAAKPTVTKTLADKTAVNNLKKPTMANGDSCPVDVTKGLSYLPPKDENTL